MGKTSRTKGRRGELELAKALQEYGYEVKAGDSVSYGRTPDLTGLNGIHIECKRVEHLNISAAMTQAVRDSKKFNDGLPTVFHRRNGEPWFVTMRLDDWSLLYSTWEPINNEIGEKLSARLELWDKGLSGDADALIELGKLYLNQHD